MSGDTLLRHGFGTRLIHAVNALTVAVLVVTGLALGDVIPASIAGILGGHLGTNATHRLLGVAFSVAVVLLVVALPRKVGRLIGNVCHWRRADWCWPCRFVAFWVSPKQRTAPYHDGRFDPAQRIVFGGILISLAAASTSGVYLYFWTPDFPLGQLSMAYAIRIHIAAAWLLIVCGALHIIAGSGILWTHRGITAAMFGNGKVSARSARTLWPASAPIDPDQRAKPRARR